MTCLCATSTLRLFVRAVAQVDLPASAIRISRHSSNTAIQLRATRELHSTPARLDSRLPHLDNNTSSGTVTPGASLPSTRSDAYAEGSSSVKKGVNNIESAFAELSPQSIDEIAAEATPYETPQPFFSRESPSRPNSKPTAPGGVAPKTTFRRTRVENSTGLAIHYSAPRTPAIPPLDSSARNPSGGKQAAEYPSKEEWTPPPREPWQIHKQALKEKFPEGWNPRKRLSPDALAGIRALHAQMPEVYTTATLAASFQVSPENIRRILKSKWSPDAEEETDRQRRWFNRGKQIYSKHADMGQKPPKRWRDLGIGKGKPEWMLKRQAKAQLPALVTTAKRGPAAKSDSASSGIDDWDSLSDRIL